MQTGMIGLGRMGANMVQRLLAEGHTCVVYARTRSTRDELAAVVAQAADSLDDMVNSTLRYAFGGYVEEP